MKLILKFDSKGMHFERASTYSEYINNLNIDNINWPAKETDYITFEKNNIGYCLYTYMYTDMI